MRNFFWTIVPVVLLLAFSGGSALAQGKIATVDLQKLFDNYYKTKLARAAIQERADELDKDYRGMADDLKKEADEYQKLLDSADDQAVSSEERDKRKQAAADKLKQLQDHKSTIDQFERQAQSTLSDQRQRMRDDILKEIKAAVDSKAKTDGDALVIDGAAQTINETPVVVYNNGDNDLTGAVLAQLNAGAPIDLNKPAVTTPSPMNTNAPSYNNLAPLTPP